MIFCNLKVLLAQRNIPVSKMSEDTNISRTTLTALCNNKSGGIQFDTLNSICSYLNVLPSEVILYSPYKIDFNYDHSNDVIEANIFNLVTRRSFKVDLLIDKDSSSIYLNHFVEEHEAFATFETLISTLPQYYLFYLDTQIKKIFENKFEDDDADIINSFSLATNLY